MIEEDLFKILKEISVGNDRGEKITLVGATKFVPAEKINRAIKAGLDHIGENHAQELRDKYDLYLPVYKHFIGRIQKNKLKYIVGKADCIDSVDTVEIAEEISSKALKLGITQDIMLEINPSDDEAKGGFPVSGFFEAYEKAKTLAGVRVVGIMSMLPETDPSSVAKLTSHLRSIYDEIKAKDENIKWLSAGISGDYRTTIKHGSNMIRLGTAIFGERDYSKVKG
ncbi:MAG: YggS family pyridoxal phosphate-dependent enzyme [Clostridia bacterium]|nr:YggS family pyridoxal phosphate-dependent enzyme [Clostridia bacterium]